MSRAGIYKSDVKKARDSLIAQGKHPSVDAVRIALGNTGSKSTIHKYLKDLEEEGDAGGSGKPAISDALQDLVARLANQLRDEADVQVAAIRAEQAEQVRRHREELAALQAQMDQLYEQQQAVKAELEGERQARAAAHESLQRETIARHIAEQHAADLKERLAENESHRRSLEEKHQHARDALEHYRQSVKDQREQDQRRHEQQLQQLQAELRQAKQAVIVKQEEVTRLNQEGVRLVSDLSHAQKALYEEQGARKQLEHKVEQLRGYETRCTVLEAGLAERDAKIATLQEQATAAIAATNATAAQLQGLQLEQATSSAKLAAAQELIAELRKVIASASAQPSTIQGT